MKGMLRLIAALFSVCLLFCSCATDPLTRTLDPDKFQNLTMQVYGTPGAIYTCRYEFGTHKGNITATAKIEPQQLMQLPVGPGTAEVAKTKPSDQLVVEVYQGAVLVLQAILQPGQLGVRVVKSDNGWTPDIY